MSKHPPTVLLVESDILVRHPLASFLRDCGYRVVETASVDEVSQLLGSAAFRLDAALIDGAEEGFRLAVLLRERARDCRIILAGSVKGTVSEAGVLCEEGPDIQKPYDHQLVLERIKRLLAARERNGFRAP